MAPSLVRSLLAAAPLLAHAARNQKHEAALVADSEGLPLCAPSIVDETCNLLGGALSGSVDDISLLEIQKALASTEKPVRDFWSLVGLSSGKVGSDGSPQVTCSDLCTSVVRFAGSRTTLPTESDLGCYRKGKAVLCDLDLRPNELKQLVPPNSELPDLHDKPALDAVRNGTWSNLKSQLDQVAENRFVAKPSDNLPVREKPRAVEYSPLQLAQRVCNLFRIYPLLDVAEVQEGDASASSLVEVEGWRTDVQQRNLEAQAYVNAALRKFRLKQTNKLVDQWFGKSISTDALAMAEVNRVLNAVTEMLSNVEYVYPGSECEDNTYAYVYPRGKLSKNQQGKYVFHLCDLYMHSERSVQIETLTHEGSHHATAYTDDVCMDNLKNTQYIEMDISSFPRSVAIDDAYTIRGNDAVVRMIKGTTVVLEVDPPEDCDEKAYGRDTCKRLARYDSFKALRNADSVCYFIQDVTDGA